MTRKQFILIISIIALIILLPLISISWLWNGPGGHVDRIINIPPKSGTVTIAGILKEKNVIHSQMMFRLAARLSGKARSLKAGEYRFAPGQSLGTVLDKLADGDVIHHAVTIPEGYTARQIAAKLAQEELVNEEDFLKVVNDPAFAKSLNLPTESLEGFLFPDTYEFAKGMTAGQIARRMTDHFFEKVDQSIIQAANEMGVDLKALITMASIIEREVRAEKERPMVASVFYNRLDKRMRLESCATVLYSQGRISGSLSLDDLQTKSPYNTYRKRGLPPGPISNPGLSSIRAAAFPAKTNYLFFVVRPDGEHIFSLTFEEHKRAKWRQKRKKRAVEQQQKSRP